MSQNDTMSIELSLVTDKYNKQPFNKDFVEDQNYGTLNPKASAINITAEKELIRSFYRPIEGENS